MAKTLTDDQFIATARDFYATRGLPARYAEKDARKILARGSQGALRRKTLRKLGFSKRAARAHARTFNMLVQQGMSVEEAAKAAAKAVDRAAASSIAAKRAATARQGKQAQAATRRQKASQLARTLDRGDGIPMVMANDIAQLSQGVSDEQAAGVTTSGKKLRRLALAAGGDPDRIALMMEPGVDPELRALFFGSLVAEDAYTLDTDVASATADEDRYRLHVNATALAEARCRTNPELDPGETYMLATQELADAQDLHANARAAADARCRVDPTLDPDKEYALAATQLGVF
jgi:hypothetical protein